MEKIVNIMRRSIHTSLQNYQYFSSMALFLIPVSFSFLLSQAFLPSSLSLIHSIQLRIQLLFDSAGFPYSKFFTVLNLKLSQSIFSFIFTIPFSFSLLILAKSAVIKTLREQFFHTSSSIFSVYYHLLLTHIFNIFVIISSNALAFFVLLICFNVIDITGSSSSNLLLFTSSSGAIFYSVILANAFIISNMATIIAGMENCGGYVAILKACVILRGRTARALWVSIPTNLGFAVIETLFHIRVVSTYQLTGKLDFTIALEAVLIGYIYSIITVLDIIISCTFYKSLKSEVQINQKTSHFYEIVIKEEENEYCRKVDPYTDCHEVA